MSKFLRINLEETDNFIYLDFSECSNILRKVEKDFDGSIGNITKDDFTNALDLIVAYFYKNELTGSMVDVELRNKDLEPAKETENQNMAVKVKDILKVTQSEVSIINDDTKDVIMVIKNDYLDHDLLSDQILNMDIINIKTFNNCIMLYVKGAIE